MFPTRQATSFLAHPALQVMENGVRSQDTMGVKGIGFESDSGSNPGITA